MVADNGREVARVAWRLWVALTSLGLSRYKRKKWLGAGDSWGTHEEPIGSEGGLRKWK